MRHRSQRGFSFIEILITVFVILVTTIIFASSLDTIATNRSDKYQDLALRIANQQLDDLRAGGYANVPASGTFTNSQLTSLPSGAASTTVSTFNAKTKKIVVGVSWQVAGKTTSYVFLSTLITSDGGL